MTLNITVPDRDLNKLVPDFKNAVISLVGELSRQGIYIIITEAKRSMARQLWLYSFGRFVSKETELKYLGYDDPIITPDANIKKAKVTWTLASKHLEGKAIDFCFKDGNTGRAFYPPASDPLWNKVRTVAKTFGIDNIGDLDRPHLQWNK